jgi:hypothetical protein
MPAVTNARWALVTARSNVPILSILIAFNLFGMKCANGFGFCFECFPPILGS